MTRELTPDIVILGGGIAGLWLLNRLRQQGFDALLLERQQLGGGQTIASQGIVHGGLKYALNGVLSPASSAIADMPEHWRRCLRGEGDVDLRDCRVLSPHYYMWSSGGYRSRLKSFLGSKALRGRIDTLDNGEYPGFFAGHRFAGSLYRLTDFVLDTPSLIQQLAAPHRDRIFRVDADSLHAVTSASGDIQSLHLRSHQGSLILRAQRYVLSAGQGNAALLAGMGCTEPAMQTRPLHMLALRIAHPQPVYLHCIGDSFGMTPHLTITSHPDIDSSTGSERHRSWIWYVGGGIAESGVQRSPEEQQAEGRRQLTEMFPWVDFSTAQWHSFFINRAEPKLPNLQRPDTAYLHASGNLLVCWPTKLTLTPNLGDSVCEELARQQIRPLAGRDSSAMLAALAECFDFPGIAAPHWEGVFS